MDRVQSLTQAYTQAPWRRQLQLIGLFLVLLVLAAVLAGIYLSVTARAATIGRDIQELQDQMEAREQEIADLESRLAFVTSSGEMEKRALSMGFRPVAMDEPLYLRVSGYLQRQTVILAPAPQAVPPPAPAMPEEYTESLFVWLQREMSDPTIPFFGVPQ